MSSIRRSQRIPVKISLVVSGESRYRVPFYQETRALLANAHGALILLRTNVTVGQHLTLKNLRTRQERACRVVSIVSKLSGPSEIGVEFLRPAPHFWNLASPPPDWASAVEEVFSIASV
jgi:hypothetical protein